MKKPLVVILEFLAGGLLAILLLVVAPKTDLLKSQSYLGSIIRFYIFFSLAFLVPVISIGFFHLKSMGRKDLFWPSVRNTFIALLATTVFYSLAYYFDLHIGRLYIMILPVAIVMGFNFILLMDELKKK